MGLSVESAQVRRVEGGSWEGKSRSKTNEEREKICPNPPGVELQFMTAGHANFTEIISLELTSKNARERPYATA